MIAKLRFTLGVAAALTSTIPAQALAHAIVVASTPAARSTAYGPDLAVEIHFNSKIDAARSRLTLVGPGGAKIEVGLTKSDSDQVLTGTASGLAPGDYRLLWQTLSIDGHISHGEIPFEVGR
jgi:methionine-rich copper-binding protein CopC